MSIRSFPVEASHSIQIEGETYDVVTDEDLMRAMQRAVIVLGVAGGMVAVVTQRKAVPGVPNFYVTTAAMVEWRDRTNAKAQPEQEGPLGEPQPVTHEVELSSEVQAELAADIPVPKPEGGAADAGASVLPFEGEERPAYVERALAVARAGDTPTPGQVSDGLVGDGLDELSASDDVDESALQGA